MKLTLILLFFLILKQNFDDNRFESATILRPMREFSSKELIFYTKHRKINKILYKTNLSTITNKPIKSSIFKMTEFFLNNLQNDFPSTIYTIFHTGSKLTTPNDGITEKCLFCSSKIDISDDESSYSAYDALRITSNLSLGLDDKISCFETQENSSEDKKMKKNKFCYSCQRLSLEIGHDCFMQICCLF